VSARDRILGRVRSALIGREATAHPGDFESWRPAPLPLPAVEQFSSLFTAAGGEVVRQVDLSAASRWLAVFAADFETAAVGHTVPPELRPPLEAALPEDAALGVSVARGAVAETGSLILDARDGRRTQLLPPTHIVFVSEVEVFSTLRGALVWMVDDLPSAIGLHSGPSKSADIGQIMVKGVHGPGRVVAVVIGG
jgi:L-lactate dehydrogenase complex protein LldG